MSRVGRRMKLGLLALLMSGGAALAQGQVTTLPAQGTSLGGLAGTTVAVTNTFQNIWPASSLRRGCMIQNNGTHSMYVSEGQALSAATTSNTAVLAAGATYYCAWSGLVLTGRIDITGTAGEAFYAAQY